MKPETVEAIARCVCSIDQGSEDDWESYLDTVETIRLTLEETPEYQALVKDAERYRKLERHLAREKRVYFKERGKGKGWGLPAALAEYEIFPTLDEAIDTALEGK